MISFTNIQKNPERCKQIVNADQLNQDIADGNLPDFSLYIPDLNNDGHDTGVAFADRWYESSFSPRIKDPAFMKGMLLITTFDESGLSLRNQIYTSFVGSMIKPGTVSHKHYNHYSILKTVEGLLGLDSLGSGDKSAAQIDDVF